MSIPLAITSHFFGYRNGKEQSPLYSPDYESDTRSESLQKIHACFLKPSGWLDSKNRNESWIKGHYVPWITFPALHFMNTMNLQNVNVMEFGSGASTVYFSEKARSVTTFESDENWANRIQLVLSGMKQKENYSIFNLPLNFDGAKEKDFIRTKIAQCDLIFIDAEPRKAILETCLEIMNDDQVILLDNSDLVLTGKIIKLLRSENVIEIPFRGIGPLNPYEWTTSFIFKDVRAINRLQSRLGG